MRTIGIKKPVWVLLLISFISRPTEAVTRRVPSEYPTIQQAIDGSSAGDLVLVAPGTYTDFETRNLDGFAWSSCAFLKNEVTVRSEQGPDVTTIDLVKLMGPQPVGVIAYKLPSTNTTVDGFRIQGVGPGPLAVVAFQCGNLVLQNCVIQDYDRGPTVGGAMIVQGNVAIIDCAFANCRADMGGAVYQADGHLEIVGSTFRECGHVALFSDDSEGEPPTSVYLSDCGFIDNWNTNIGPGGGAGIYGTDIIVTECVFRGNKNTVQSGAGLTVIGTDVSVERCIFIENESSKFGGRGGGLLAWGFPLLTIRNNTFFRNAAPQGAAVDMNYGTFGNNIVFGSRDGAAIIAESGLDSSCNVFWDNPQGIGYPLAPTDREVDPLFCDQGALDLTLRKGSPCLPEDPLGCGLIGALGQGCGTISVDSKSWGSIKGLYR